MTTPPRSVPQFVNLFMRHQNRIYAYILTYVPHAADADDVMQEAATVAWEKFETFQPGTDFALWVKKIAYYKILDYRKRGGSHQMIFSDDLIRTLATQADRNLERTDSRLKALRRCLRRLKAEDRHLLRQKYVDGVTIKDIAKQADRSVHGLYKVMLRIHSQLRRCVNFTLSSGKVFE